MSAEPIAVFSERTDLALELLAAARRLAGAERRVVTFDLGPADRASLLIEHGADCVLSFAGDEPLPDVPTRAALLARAVSHVGAGVLLVGATREGAETAARLGQRMGVACASGCMSLSLDGDALIAERRHLGGFVARVRLLLEPALATVAPGRHEPLPRDPTRNGSVERLDRRTPPPIAAPVILTSRPRALGRAEIDKARVVVSVGRGVRRPEDVRLAADLARTLGGAVGASRPLTDHLQWLPADVKVGLSGKTVRPELYVACGISGQVEHIVGMREAKVVVAINSDPSAPIFKESDYGVVGDLHVLVPALARALEALYRVS